MSLEVHKLTFFHANQSETNQNTSGLVKYNPFSNRCQSYFLSKFEIHVHLMFTIYCLEKKHRAALFEGPFSYK